MHGSFPHMAGFSEGPVPLRIRIHKGGSDAERESEIRIPRSALRSTLIVRAAIHWGFG